MARDNKRQQRQHEIAVCNRLLKNLNLPAEFIREGDDRAEPDVIFSVNNQLLGIEITTAYYDESYAKGEWEVARGQVQVLPGTLLSIWSGDSPDEKLFKRIQEGILRKCSKTYKGVDRAWLCVASQGHLSGEKEVVADFVKRLIIPRTHQFERIYLHYQAPWHEEGGWCSIELQPT